MEREQSTQLGRRGDFLGPPTPNPATRKMLLDLHSTSQLGRINMEFILIMSQAKQEFLGPSRTGGLPWHDVWCAGWNVISGLWWKWSREAIVPLIAPQRAWFTVILMPWPPVDRHHKKREKWQPVMNEGCWGAGGQKLQTRLALPVDFLQWNLRDPERFLLRKVKGIQNLWVWDLALPVPNHVMAPLKTQLIHLQSGAMPWVRATIITKKCLAPCLAQCH